MKIAQFMLSFLCIISANSFAAEPAHDNKPPMEHGAMMLDEQHLQAMQAHLLTMHDLSTQILQEKDAAKKEVLKQQQRDVMKAHHEQMMANHAKMMK